MPTRGDTLTLGGFPCSVGLPLTPANIRPPSGECAGVPPLGSTLAGMTTEESPFADVAIEADREVVVLLAHPAFVLETKAVVQRELRADAEVVLHVPAEVVRVDIERRRQRERARGALEVPVRQAEQERRHRVAVERVAVGEAGRRGELSTKMEVSTRAAGVVEVDTESSGNRRQSYRCAIRRTASRRRCRRSTCRCDRSPGSEPPAHGNRPA